MIIENKKRNISTLKSVKYYKTIITENNGNLANIIPGKFIISSNCYKNMFEALNFQDLYLSMNREKNIYSQLIAFLNNGEVQFLGTTFYSN